MKIYKISTCHFSASAFSINVERKYYIEENKMDIKWKRYGVRIVR